MAWPSGCAGAVARLNELSLTLRGLWGNAARFPAPPASSECPMARVTVEDCVDKVPNRFDLVLLAAQRAREISGGAELTIERDRDKNPVVALREIAEETVRPKELHEAVIGRCSESCPRTRTRPTRSARSASRPKRCASPPPRRSASPPSAATTRADRGRLQPRRLTPRFRSTAACDKVGGKGVVREPAAL